MGMKMGRWQSQHVPNNLEYPFKIAASMAVNVKSISQEEASEFITKTKRFWELCRDQDTIIRQLRKELDIAEQTVKLLQVSDS